MFDSLTLALENNIWLAIGVMVVGIVFVVKGGDWFVDAASWMAEVSGIPKLIVGATVVSVATTLPELLVSSLAAAEGENDMAIGNAIGSVTANMGLILAIALIVMPMAVDIKEYRLKSLLMIGASAVIVAFGRKGSIPLWGSLILLVICAVAWYENISKAVKTVKLQKAQNIKDEKEPVTGKIVAKNIVLFIIGAACIVFGAEFMVDSGKAIATIAGVPERIISVTIIAVGTSLPELVTTLTAVIKKDFSLSAGNIIGANILDLCLIMPVCGFISGKALPFSSGAGQILDLVACLVVGAIVVFPMLAKKKFMRWQGITILAVYAAYVALTCGAFGIVS